MSTQFTGLHWSTHNVTVFTAGCQSIAQPLCCGRCQPPPAPSTPPLLSNWTISYPTPAGLTPAGHMLCLPQTPIPTSDSIRA